MPQKKQLDATEGHIMRTINVYVVNVGDLGH